MQTNQYQTTQVQIELQDTQQMKLVCEEELVKVHMDLVAVRIELQATQLRGCEFESILKRWRMK